MKIDWRGFCPDSLIGTYQQVVCEKCGKSTYQKVHAEYMDYDDTSVDIEYEYIVFNRHFISQCLKCRVIQHTSLTQEYVFEEFRDDWEDIDDNNHTPAESSDPSQESSVGELRPYRHADLAELMPPIVSSIYQETIKAANYSIRTLAAAGMRAVIEAVCNDQLIMLDDSRLPPLAKRISLLRTEKELITARIESSLIQQLRAIGNIALHQADPPSEKELQLALNVLDHFLKEIYSIEDQKKKLHRETQSRLKKPIPDNKDSQ